MNTLTQQEAKRRGEGIAKLLMFLDMESSGLTPRELFVRRKITWEILLDEASEDLGVHLSWPGAMHHLTPEIIDRVLETVKPKGIYRRSKAWIP